MVKKFYFPNFTVTSSSIYLAVKRQFAFRYFVLWVLLTEITTWLLHQRSRPVTKAESSETRNSTALATSLGVIPPTSSGNLLAPPPRSSLPVYKSTALTTHWVRPSSPLSRAPQAACSSIASNPTPRASSWCSQSQLDHRGCHPSSPCTLCVPSRATPPWLAPRASRTPPFRVRSPWTACRVGTCGAPPPSVWRDYRSQRCWTLCPVDRTLWPLTVPGFKHQRSWKITLAFLGNKCNSFL